MNHAKKYETVTHRIFAGNQEIVNPQKLILCTINFFLGGGPGGGQGWWIG